MVFTRTEVWANGGDFDDDVLYWYAMGVRVLKEREITDPTSWVFLAGIHGFDRKKWEKIEGEDYLNLEPLPDDLTQEPYSTYWEQCQHGSWYFLPWHRGYLASWEKIVRDAIVELGGPRDWALPYWNYSKNTDEYNPRELPPAFSQREMTIRGGGPTILNPLFVQERYGPGIFDRETYKRLSDELPPEAVKLDDVLQIDEFTAVDLVKDEDSFVEVEGFGGVGRGVGDVEIGFNHETGLRSGLESQPHDSIHVSVGGLIPDQDGDGRPEPGLLADPDTAGLDPIFWVHHANVDRLWQVWLLRETAHQNPSQANWLDGPPDGQFVLPSVGGGRWEFTPRDMLDTTAPDLDYEYDDVSDPLEGETRIDTRLRRLKSIKDSSKMDKEQKRLNVELIGANRKQMKLTGTAASTQVHLDNKVMKKLERSFEVFSASEDSIQEPDCVFLKIENIRSAKDGTMIKVYVNLPEGANPDEHLDLYAGTIAFFGVRRASLIDSSHGGLGLNRIFDITKIIDELYLSEGLGVRDLRVDFIFGNKIAPDDNVTVERVSIYRQEK